MGAIFLSVKKWLLRKKHQIELARKRGWKGYWVCLKGTTLLFYPCDSREGRSVEAAPKHLIIVDGAIMQPIPEHPKRDYIFCLSTAFGDAYLFQAPYRLHAWENVVQYNYEVRDVSRPPGKITSLIFPGERPHVCTVCGKGFSTSSSLNTHSRIHSGEKPHQCQYCGKRFTASSNLYYHRMTHSKDKPHKCCKCPKSFPTPGDLRAHSYIHTGEWPYRCAVCGRGFCKQANLRNHQQLHSL
ncbi:zinc finger protein 235-like [Frankliniella occidentalis]|uniref:Zinc finger protein 235-like n=1 Tax=Frankliniella occidentalis TaxID=133901 RepID=A0A9C6XDB8_FRAOC|nr:zinc finger protein 235-like [Frankliniella occidentalis]